MDLLQQFLYIPFLYFFNIIGIVLSRLLGVFTLAYFYIKPILKSNNGYNAVFL